MSAKAMVMPTGSGLDTPYVVKFHNTYQLAKDKPLFQFDHPNKAPPELIDNTRLAIAAQLLL
jgi:hypothetical protein